MTPPDVVSGVDFSGDSFVVMSALIGTDYAIKTSSGEKLLSARRRFFDERQEYEFRDDDTLVLQYVRGEPTEGRTRFELREADSGAVVATLVREDPAAEERWEVRPASTGDVAARIVTEEAGRSLLGTPSGQQMNVTTAEGEPIGEVSRRTLSVHLTFDVTLPDLDGVAKAAAVLAVPLLYDEMQPGSEFETMGEN